MSFTFRRMVATRLFERELTRFTADAQVHFPDDENALIQAFRSAVNTVLAALGHVNIYEIWHYICKRVVFRWLTTTGISIERIMPRHIIKMFWNAHAR